MTQPRRTFMTPPEVATLLRVRIDKVRTWIRNAELRAIDVSECVGGRPRYRIAHDDLDAFLSRRQVTPPPTSVVRRQEAPIKSYV